MKLVDPNTNILRDSADLQFADKVFGLKALGKHWEAIDAIVDHWLQSNPKKYKSFLIEMDVKRNTRSNKSASNKAKSLRSLADVPEDVILRIRKVYGPSELIMDKDFFTQMYKRYPAMRVAEKL